MSVTLSTRRPTPAAAAAGAGRAASGPLLSLCSPVLCHLIGSEPCPSLLLQRHMAELLSMDKDMAASFLNSVLNQLNWAFSEFIGMIQEVRTTRVPAGAGEDAQDAALNRRSRNTNSHYLNINRNDECLKTLKLSLISIHVPLQHV